MIFKSLYYPYLIYSTNQINAFLKSLISLSLVLKKLMNGIAIYLYLKKKLILEYQSLEILITLKIIEEE